MAFVLSGKAHTKLSKADATSKLRVQDVVDPAMLARDILHAIASGEQPDTMRSDYLIISGFPASWSERREQFAKP